MSGKPAQNKVLTSTQRFVVYYFFPCFFSVSSRLKTHLCINSDYTYTNTTMEHTVHRSSMEQATTLYENKSSYTQKYNTIQMHVRSLNSAHKKAINSTSKREAESQPDEKQTQTGDS